MKIAVDGRYIQDYFPGIGRYTYNLVENLAGLEEDEVTVLYNPSLANSRYDLHRLEAQGKAKLQIVGARTFSVYEQLAIPALLVRQGFRVLHSPYYVKPYWQTSRSVVTIHDVIMKMRPEDAPSRKARVLFDLAIRLSLRSAARIITCSRFSKESLIEGFRANPEKVRVIYESADARFRPREKSELKPLRERLRLPERFALYVGINKPHKNLVRLVEAFAQVRSEVDLDLVIAGKEDLRYPEARAKAERIGVSERVRFVGNIAEADLPGIYNLAEMFVFPSLCEGFGLPVLEAMASGVPVVCSNTSSLPEIAGDCALLVDPRAVAEIAQGIARVATDHALAQRLGTEGIQRAAQFSWIETARQTLAVYREALT